MRISIEIDSLDELEKLRALLNAISPMTIDPPKKTAPLASLGLSVRTHNILVSENISTVEDLLPCRGFDLLLFPNFGRRALNEVIEKLAALGLTLSGP